MISKYIEITDIDVLFYPKTEKKFVSLNNALNILFSTNYVYETQNFDLPTKHILSTSDYKNSEGVNLSDYIFVLNRDEFSYKFGFLNAINLEAFFLTKLATIGKRNSARDIECTNIAVNLMNGVPEMIYRVIDDFSMRDNSLVNAYLNSL